MHILWNIPTGNEQIFINKYQCAYLRWKAGRLKNKELELQMHQNFLNTFSQLVQIDFHFLTYRQNRAFHDLVFG